MAFPEYVSDTIVSSVTYLFTSVEEIHLEFSRIGEYLHTDDMNILSLNYDENNLAGVTQDNYLIQLCQRATSHMMEVLGNRYKANVIYRIPRIREIATYWACYKLSGRRGNPKLYEEEYLDAMESLEGYRDGSRYLAAPSNGQHALMHSYIVDNRFFRNPIRVLQLSSTGVKPGQAVVWLTPFYWL